MCWRRRNLQLQRGISSGLVCLAFFFTHRCYRDWTPFIPDQSNASPPYFQPTVVIPCALYSISTAPTVWKAQGIFKAIWLQQMRGTVWTGSCVQLVGLQLITKIKQCFLKRWNEITFEGSGCVLVNISSLWMMRRGAWTLCRFSRSPPCLRAAGTVWNKGRK